MNPHKHQHAYYEYKRSGRSRRENSKRGPKAGIVFCKNDGNCVHFLEPRAMARFRKIIRAGQQPIIREYPDTHDRFAKQRLGTNRMLVAIYPKPTRKTTKR
ncbi:MAG: hypothetical protein MOGMAGMI_02536 [Candidatus Omnitrophica bacterium]|nr:hypothetical protein [Candidatus Omnitrophota bacterium]